MPADDDARPWLRIARITEADFDRLVTAAGGRRSANATGQTKPSADYELGNALLELKLIEEEGLQGPQKADRQRKVAELFRGIHPDDPVIVLDPADLDAERRRRYFNLLGGPIQTAVRKAARQLEGSRAERRDDPVRVLILVNNGYAALSHDDFVQIVLKSVRNDTRCVDSVVIGGVYYYTDEFDSYALFPFEEHAIDVGRRFRSFEVLRDRWGEFADEVMNEALRGVAPHRFQKMPVSDISFDVNSVTFVKPAPPMGVESQFWANGRPRRNSTGLTVCPPVGRTFPDLEDEDWPRFRAALPGSNFLRPSYIEWIRFRDEELARVSEVTKPIVPVRIVYDAFVEWCRKSGERPSEHRMFAYAAHVFDQAVRALALSARDVSETSVMPARYVFVQTNEIGQDRAYDFSSVSLVREGIVDRDVVSLVSSERIFYEHALALAAAYAFKSGVEVILFEKIRTHAWV